MPMRMELAFTYDERMCPISAKCTRCGETMPKPPPDLRLSEEIVAWFAEKFLAHKQQKHAQRTEENESGGF